MQQTMGNFICLNNIIITILATLLFIGCEPSEPKLELGLKRQTIGEPFTFNDYCEEEYDSIYLIHPYDDESVIWSLPYRMSHKLKEEISYTLDDTFTRILFIDNDTVKAYTEIGKQAAKFSKSEITNNGPKFSFRQRFVLDENSYIHIYEGLHFTAFQ